MMDDEMDWDSYPDSKEPKERQRKPRNHAGPLPKPLYDLFFSALRAKKQNQVLFPSGPELKSLGFPKPMGGHTRRERFKLWAQRMDIVVDPDTNSEALIHKKSGKVIIPLEDFESVIRSVHENNGDKHNDFKTTMDILQDKYTMGAHAFGMGRGVIRFIVDTCQDCIMEMALSKKTEDKNGISSPMHICNGRIASESCSMAAHIPNAACIWFDKSVLTTQEPYSKLLMLITELKGELPGIAKGNKGAKDRFIYKLYSTIQCIKSQNEQIKTKFQTSEPYTREMHEQLVELSSVYKQEGKEELFSQDMELLLNTYATNGYSDYFLRSLKASISSITNEAEVVKPQVTYITLNNGFALDLNQSVICLQRS